MRFLITLAAAALLAGPASAQWRNMMVDGLQPADVEAMGVAGAALEGKEIGHEEAWTSPDTGNSGTVRLLKEDVYQDMPCQHRGHTVNIARTQRSTKLVFRVCKTPDGRWLDAPPQQ